MGELSHRSDAEAGDWTELEQGFFAAAPPEIAVEPPPALTFDDLGPTDGSINRPTKIGRVRRKRAARPRRRAELQREPGRLAGAGTLLRQVAGRAGSFVRPVRARAAGAWRWTLARLAGAARLLAPRLAPWLLAMRKRVEGSLEALLSRLARDLPERPDGKTIAVATVALLLVFGISASVLGSRGPRSAAPSLAAPSEIALGTPAAAGPPTAAPVAPEPAEAPQAAVRPRTTLLTLPPVQFVARRHRARHHR